MASCRPSLDLTRAELGLPALKRQFPHLEVGCCGVESWTYVGDFKSVKGVTPPGVFRVKGRSTDSRFVFHRAQVDVLAAFLDDAEGAGLSDESFVALMDRLGACGGKALTRLFLA